MKPPADAFVRWLTGMAAPAGPGGGLAILIYHRILPEADEISSDVTARVFDAQMRGLTDHFTPVRLSEALDRLDSGSLPSRAVCVTFDDGYRNNAEVALPILERHGVPATFFVATGFMDGGVMWNDAVIEAIRASRSARLDLERWGQGVFALDTSEARRECAKKLLTYLKYTPPEERESKVHDLAEHLAVAPPRDLMMRAEHVRALKSAGMEIGAHSVSHPILAKLSRADAEREIVESGRHLAEILREPTRLFAYPNGKPGLDYAPEHVEMVRKAGYRSAFATIPGMASVRSDRYQVPRIAPWGRNPRGFSLRLARTFMRAGHPQR